MRSSIAIILALSVLVLVPSGQAANGNASDRAEAARLAHTMKHPEIRSCGGVIRAAIYYRLRHGTWNELRGQKVKVVISSPQGCAHAAWRAKLWKGRARKAREAYVSWNEEQARRTLKDFRVVQGQNAWLRAIDEVQRAYPGTGAWLRSCSATEGGWGRWVPNSEGSGVGGWLQFMPGTFAGFFRHAHDDVTARGFVVPESAASWYSPLGQALAGAWGLTNGKSYHWFGSGC